MYRKQLLGIALAIAMGATPGTGRGGDLDRFFPREADLVVSLNAKQLLQSPLGQKYAVTLINEAIGKDKELQEVIKKLGINPLTDIQRISVAVGLEEIGNPKAVTVIQGRFDPAVIGELVEKLAKTEPTKFAVDKSSGKAIYKISRHGLPSMYVAPVDSTTIVSGTQKEFITAAFEIAAGTRKPEIKKELAELVARMETKSTLSLAAYTKGRLESIPLPDASMKKIVNTVEAITMDIDVVTDIRLELAMDTGGPADAKRMKDLLAGGIELAKVQIKLAASQQPSYQPLADLANSFVLSQRDNAVVVVGKMTGDGLDKLLKK